MTLRTGSRTSQRLLWLCGILVALNAYVFLSRRLFGSVVFDLRNPNGYYLAVPLAVLFALFAWLTRWDGTTRKDVKEESEEDVSTEADIGGTIAQGKGVEMAPMTKSPTVKAGPAPGEALYLQARKMKHRPIPNFAMDGEYLHLLGASAAEGYPRAMAKLGDYAARRRAWVEAYYWTWRAQHGGMRSLAPILRGIRQNWVMNGHPEQRSNVSELFSEEAGDIGRALLEIDSGRNVADTREFLKEHFPDWH